MFASNKYNYDLESLLQTRVNFWVKLPKIGSVMKGFKKFKI